MPERMKGMETMTLYEKRFDLTMTVLNFQIYSIIDFLLSSAFSSSLENLFVMDQFHETN